jgi:hypothetical protein
VSLHASGVFQITYEKEWIRVLCRRRKLRITLANDQPLSTFQGCESPNEQIISKPLFGQMRKFNPQGRGVQAQMFIVDLGQFNSPMIRVTIYLFDQANLGLFQSVAGQPSNAVISTIMSVQPCVGLIVHE